MTERIVIWCPILTGKGGGSRISWKREMGFNSAVCVAVLQEDTATGPGQHAGHAQPLRGVRGTGAA